MSNENSISLNKYIASTGYCSRRDADVLIEKGLTTINGNVAKKGNRVEEGDIVKVEGKLLSNKPKLVYIALNKPQGVTCTTDPRDPTNIIDFIGHKERIFPIGRLDKPSTGLILLTNDGDIVNKILRANNNHEKEYIVTVDQPITRQFIHKMANGLPVLGVITNKCVVEKISKYTFRIILTQGLNRQIRRMCEYLEYRVIRLKRVRIMNITLEDLPLKKWRNLTKAELEELDRLTKSSIK